MTDDSSIYYFVSYDSLDTGFKKMNIVCIFLIESL